MTKCNKCGKQIKRGNMGQRYCLCSHPKSANPKKCKKCGKWLFPPTSDFERCECHELRRQIKQEKELAAVEGKDVYQRLTYHAECLIDCKPFEKTQINCKRKAIKRNMKSALDDRIKISTIGVHKGYIRKLRSNPKIQKYFKLSKLK